MWVAPLLGRLLAGGVSAHGDDGRGAELRGGEDAAEADRAVADDDDARARLNVGADRGVPSGAHDVGQGQQAGDQVSVRLSGRSKECAVGGRDADPLRLAPVEPADVLAVGVHALGADRTGVVAVQEAADDEVAGRHGGHGIADLLEDADVLVPHRGSRGDLLDAAVAPQVRAADAGGDGADHGVGGLDDDGIRPLLESDVPGGMDDGSSHDPIRLLDPRRREGLPLPP
jgi:hypothetical protein